jgi:hypothetical protein
VPPLHARAAVWEQETGRERPSLRARSASRAVNGVERHDAQALQVRGVVGDVLQSASVNPEGCGWLGEKIRPTKDIDLLGSGDTSAEELKRVFTALWSATALPAAENAATGTEPLPRVPEMSQVG